MVNKLFVGMIRTTMEFNVDDILVMSIKGIDHTKEANKSLECMCHHQIHLNSPKCAFGVHSRKFLRFMVNQRETEVNSKNLHRTHETTNL